MWIECITEEDLAKWNIVVSMKQPKCENIVTEHLKLISRKKGRCRFFVYVVDGIPKIALRHIYKPLLDMYRICNTIVIDSSYLLIAHIKARDLMVETGKKFYMPTEHKTADYVQKEILDAHKDKTINAIWDSLGVKMTTKGDITVMEIIG